ncbi:MAG: protocatechuate 3,4-dioxygenase [Rickettsiales bacterium]|jgi:protocatechuate 3,4-dioxygenase beta subunit|nr:protocatechuate 3,4-dioxygenase [Rickettsiales bacterium]
MVNRQWIKTVVIGITLIGSAFPQNAQALSDEVVTTCTITPTVLSLVAMPEAIALTNNLRRKTASPLLADGVPIYIRGVVRDERCVPIPGVRVQVWQADAKGYYVTDSEGVHDADADPNFTGSGTATTDNMGHYEFITILPGEAEGRPPVVHLRVKHPEFGIVETDLFFDKMPGATEYHKHLTEVVAKLLTAESQPIDYSAPDAGTVYHFDITLEGAQPTRNF